MTEINRQKLLFLLIDNQKLIYHATRWDLRNMKDGNALPTPKRLSSYERDFTGPDLHAVDAHIELIQELDDDSVESIYREAANVFTENKGPLKPRDFPLNPSQDDLRDRIRKPKLSRIEFALLSLGFLLPKSGQSGFDLFVFENRVENRIYVNLIDFPLARALVDREEALHSTGEFGSSVPFYRTDKVDTLKAAEWLHQMGYELPKGMLKMARQFHGSRSEPLKSAHNELNPKERSSLLQLIHALAAKRPYQFDESDPRNGAISRIETALADAGLTMSDKTIRKYLRCAKDEVERIIEKDQ